MIPSDETPQEEEDMGDVLYSTDIDRQDARPRMPGEPGEHIDSLDIRPPEELPAKAVQLRWYDDGHFDVVQDGVMMRCVGFERDEEGKEVYIFKNEEEE